MAVGFRAVGSWQDGATGLTNDEVVAVPADQVTGDLVIVIGCWKDWSITAQVSGYTELFELADGTTDTGNGTGSMKVGAWYKVATSDAEADPTLDFSTTTGLLGEATIIVFSKDAGDTWLTPTYVTGAWTNGGSSAQTISASSTITVPSGGAVLGVLAIRDDSSTFTRPTTAIDDADAAITWNGDYVEAPTTHASTTTGNDMAADAGYRLVTTGAAGVTLRQTAQLSANETGQGAWIVLGAAAPGVTAAPSPASLVMVGAVPGVVIGISSTPTAASLTLTGAVPAVTVGPGGLPPVIVTTITPGGPTASLTASGGLKATVTPTGGLKAVLRRITHP